jgi:putative transposase
MPRLARIVVPGLPHHVTQRGNNQQDVFFNDQDRMAYLAILKQECSRHGVALLGYCLMDNHVHLIPVPRRADSLAKAMGRTHWKYTQHINLVHHRSGHLWQNRFYSNAMDDDHCVVAMRYIEWNPIRAGICRIARRYPWSSAAAHCGGEDAPGILDLQLWHELAGKLNWESAIATEPSPAEVNSVRRALRTGRPLAEDSLMLKLGRKFGRDLRAKPPGRPRKNPRG